LTTGERRTCGLTGDGEAYCWGNGGLGREPGTFGWGPQRVMTDIRFTQLAVGYDHACGLTESGAAHCWGYNSRGQLGRGNTSFGTNHTPLPVATSVEFLSIAAKGFTTCAISRARDVYCWGTRLGATIWDEPAAFFVPTKVEFKP
jgi:alpha-tubulin suppressor-like RCC1 family protein